MTIIQITILVFTMIEIANIMTLYFNPGSKMGNGIGIFKAWKSSKEMPQVHGLVKYLVNWVAGAKLIFIMMALVVVFWGSDLVQKYTVVALILSILSFYWRLYPMIKAMDKRDEISPKGYSKTLGWMITSFIGVFVVALLTSL